jgi:hypothetical protein
LLKIDAPAYLAPEMLAVQAINASMHHAYPVSKQSLPVTHLMLTRLLMKIHKKQHLGLQTIDVSKFSVG